VSSRSQLCVQLRDCATVDKVLALVGKDEVNRLYLELGSESRLGILRALKVKDYKMRELGRHLGLTATEAFRQVKRLTEAQLIQRLPEGSYTITPYGRLVLQLSSAHEFTFRNREYFSNHDLSRLPLQFVSRIGELSGASLSMDAVHNVNKGMQMVITAKAYFWGMVEEEGSSLLGPAAAERMRTGVKYRFLLPESLHLPDTRPLGTAQSLAVRRLPDIPLIMGITEKEVGVFFRFIGGRADYAGFVAEDQTSIDWAHDLFMHYWEKAASSRTI